MNIKELIRRIEVADRKRTKKDRFKLLVKAKILDKDGYYDSRFFSKDTVEKSKLSRNI